MDTNEIVAAILNMDTADLNAVAELIYQLSIKKEK